jgi:hypothetical protein
LKITNTCIWKLERTLSEIVTLLQRDYSKYVEVLEECDISEIDKKLIYRWITTEQVFDIKETTVNNTKVKYIKVFAEIETPAIPLVDWVIDSIPLPKEIRVNKNSSRVVFVERLGSTYCIVIGSKSSEGRIRSTLMESAKRKESSWGKIEFKEVTGYIFDKHFYYWLIKNKNKSLTIDENRVVLNDVKGFKSDMDRNENSYSGEGSNIDLEIPLKSLVSMDEKLVSLYIDLLMDSSMTYNFFLDYDGRINIYEAECGEFATQTPTQIPIEKIVMDIYFRIIPLLRTAFNKALLEGWNDIESKFKKKLSLDVIIGLIKQNDIEIAEISEVINNN